MKSLQMKLIIIFSVLIFPYISGYPQSALKDTSKHVYKINYWVTVPVILVGSAANLLSITRIQNKSDITDAEFNALNKNTFSSFDQRAFHQDIAQVQKNRDYATYTLLSTVFLPVFMLIDNPVRKDWGKFFLMCMEMHTITYSLYNFSPLGPTFQNKFRPVVYYDQLSRDARKSGGNRSSFYSGHVASATAGTFFMAKVYCDYHPNLGWKKYLLYAAATLPPLLLADLRVKALKHFPSDNMAGLAIGAICGIIVPELHRIKNKNISMSVSSNTYGTSLNFVWHPAQSVKINSLKSL